MAIQDNFGRELTNLRISVTQHCNQSCIYCHHEGQDDGSDEMSPQEIGRLVRIGEDLGFKKLKITGGEPLMREDIVEVVEECARSMDDISLTTNGTLLSKIAKDLKSSGVKRVNISLDSIDDVIYRDITGQDHLQKAIEGIDAAVEAGFDPVKINLVVLKGLNDNTLERMLEFARDHKSVLQIIELEAPRESIASPFFSMRHRDLSDIEKSLKDRAIRTESRKMNHRQKYFLPQEVEVVRPMHNTDFCANCHRLRITSNGKLKPCLLSKKEIDVLSLLRGGALDSEIRERFLKAIAERKPYWS